MIFNDFFLEKFRSNLKKMWYVIVIAFFIGAAIVFVRIINETNEYNGRYYTAEVYLKISVIDKQLEIEDETLHESNSNILKNISDIYNSNSARYVIDEELVDNGYSILDDSDMLTMSSNGKLVTLRISSLDKEKAIFIANSFAGIAVEKTNDILQYTSLEIEEEASNMSVSINETERSHGAFSVENIFIVFCSTLIGIILIFAFTILCIQKRKV